MDGSTIPPEAEGRLMELRRRLRGMEAGIRRLPLGLSAVDAALGGGLALGCLHEVAGEADDGAADGFCAALLSCLPAGKPVLWCRPEDGAPPYAHGLRAFGLDPERIILATIPRPADRLWAMEEALRCRDLAAVLGEVDSLDATASRRLQLAAEAGGTVGLLLRRHGTSTTAVTRWQVSSAPSGAGSLDVLPGPSRWRVQLRACRGGRPGGWLMEWSDAGSLAVVAVLRDGPAASAA